MKRVLATCFVFLSMIGAVVAQDRFPRPDFESAYQKPVTPMPLPRAFSWEVVDTLLLIFCLALAGWFALKLRSRRALLLLSVFSIFYFGFFRKGCVCAVGSIQNVAFGLAQSDSVLPLMVILVFVVPLLFTLFFGRIFCAAVCPLGVTQDLLSVKSFRIPRLIAHVLGLLPHVYIGVAVLLAATGSAFLICRYDPFVTLFRMHGNFGQVMLTAAFVMMSLFFARPYCRFLCPYGVLLGWMSKLSFKHLTITPDTCIDCRLCEASCPFDAINKPTPERPLESRDQGIKKMKMLFILLPGLILFGGWSVSRAAPMLSGIHMKVRIAERILLEDAGVVPGTTLDTRSFRALGAPKENLMNEAASIVEKIRIGGWILGGYLGFVLFLKLTGLTVIRKRTGYAPDKENCLSCGRCFRYCPVEHKRKKSDPQRRIKQNNDERK